MIAIAQLSKRADVLSSRAVKGWRFAVLALIVSAPTTLQAAEATIVVLHQDVLVQDEQRLVEALRIYTRDLDSRVFVGGDAPTSVDAPVLEQVAADARGENAEVVLWAHRRADGVAVFYLFNGPTGDLRETEVPANGSERAAIEVALKVRALLSTRREITRAAESPPSAVARPPSQPAVPTVLAVTAGASPPPPPRGAPRLALAAGFLVLSPTDTNWLSVGLIVGAAVRLGGATSGYWLYLDGALTSPRRSQVRGYDVTLNDMPFGAGIQAVWSRRAFNLALGTRTGFHVFDVDAMMSSDGKAGAARRYALGLGGLARAELGLGHHVKLALTILAEALVPAQQFTITGQQALGTGSVLLGAAAGVVVPLP